MVAVLLVCSCRTQTERLADRLRGEGIFITFQLPKENFKFVKTVRETVKKMGYERMAHYTLLKPAVMERTANIGADVKKKEGGKFMQVANWRCPPMKKSRRENIPRLYEPE
jgi:hypothetical protein